MFAKTDIEKYFIAEKNESLLFVFIGIAAIILAVVFFFFLKTNFYKGIALPLFLIGLVQFSAGFVVYKRSDADRKKNVYAYDLNPSELKEKEIPRMEKVNGSFIIFRWVEIALIIAGVALIILYRSNMNKSFLYGLGIGILMQAVILFAGDSFAAARAKGYFAGLKEFIQKN